MPHRVRGIADLDELLATDVEPDDRVLLVSSVLLLLRSWRGDPVDELIAEMDAFTGDRSDPIVRHLAVTAHAYNAFALAASSPTR